jgi:hypothetical protein
VSLGQEQGRRHDGYARFVPEMIYRVVISACGLLLQMLGVTGDVKGHIGSASGLVGTTITSTAEVMVVSASICCQPGLAVEFASICC